MILLPKIYRSYLLLLLCSICISCKEEEPYVITCKDGEVAWEHTPPMSYTLRNVGDRPNYTPNIKLKIQTQADYEYYFASDYLPTIDFKRKTLLVARTDQWLSYTTNVKVTANCDKRELIWEIDAVRNESGPHYPNDFRPKTFELLVPKISGNTDFSFNPKIIK